MKNNIKFAILSGFVAIGVLAGQLYSEDTFEVLGNGGRGTADGYSAEAINWYKENLPTLPANYIETQSFVRFEPLLHYADHVNWSLFPLKNFKDVSKNRWIRVPAGTKIKRDAETGIWEWPVGAETAKMLGGSVKGKNGKTQLQNFELRLARKISEDDDGKGVWAMATYVKDKSGKNWIIAMPPHLELVIPNGLTKHGTVRKISYSLTSPEGCMTCHSRGSYSNVDYKRGDEFVYGANEELLSGKVKMRLSEYLASKEISEVTTEVERSEVQDWIRLEYKDKNLLERNQKALAPLFE